MDGDQRFYQRHWFSPLLWTLFSLGFYAWQVIRLGGLQASLIYILGDAILFIGLMVVWLAFFAQFILPIFRFRERQKIFDRLVSYIMGSRGPAIFIRDGIPLARKGEKELHGPGVLWLDSASAAQLRTVTKFTRALGPGIHFTSGGETIAGTVDLHLQAQGAGPQGKDKPFEPQPEGMSDDEYDAIQKRRGETSALTRDGIEVVPTINVIFKIDADPVEGEGPGSHFADVKPITDKNGKVIEEANPVFKAIVGEGVNPNLLDKEPEKQRVAWNRIPAILAADLWREYLSKFTLNELFQATQDIPPEGPPPLQPTLDETTKLFEAVKASPPQNAWQDHLAEMLHEVNRILRGWAEKLEIGTPLEPTPPAPPKAPPPFVPGQPRRGTALEVIGAMMRARMTQEIVDELDDHGDRIVPKHEILSSEYAWLKRRGLRVIAVSVSNLRFTKAVEDQLVRQWETSWLDNARTERHAIDAMRGIAEMQGREMALRDYIRALGTRQPGAEPPQGLAAQVETIRTLITRMHTLVVRNTRLHRRLSNEMTEMDDLLKWLEGLI